MGPDDFCHWVQNFKILSQKNQVKSRKVKSSNSTSRSELNNYQSNIVNKPRQYSMISEEENEQRKFHNLKNV